MRSNVSFICAFAAHVTLRFAVSVQCALNSCDIVLQLLCNGMKDLRASCRQAHNRTHVSALALSRQLFVICCQPRGFAGLRICRPAPKLYVAGSL